ncbi:MAG TPA: hypothetical protein PLE75_04760 [Ferruginibacter sp.]|nr:hypothetical protein [Ferruginibacter sp.]HRO05975.1 hypothetical protein [Ferruginibacter sp.]HRO97238.1 hypothetical protein [Ferruginibacter sp.]HRP49858.1 hypothetical protein [Ferruginibacter sp.]
MTRWILHLFVVLMLWCNNGIAQTNWLHAAPKAGELPFEVAIEYKKSDVGKHLDSLQWIKAGLQKLEAYNGLFKYYLNGYVPSGTDTLYILSRVHTEELIQWVCLFDKNGVLSDYIMAAYDNSEGFLIRETKLLPNGLIEVNEYSEIEGTEEQFKFTINGLKFRKSN